MNSPPAQQPRFVGLDVHKNYVVAAGVDAQQNLVLPARHISFGEFERWITKNLNTADRVVLEATTNAWHIFDQIRPLVASVVVAHPLLVKLITAARVKTDPRDAIKLARLLAAGLVPEVWVPPTEVRELRGLVSHRRRLVNQRTQARNRLHSMLHRHNLVAPAGEPFSAANRSWWTQLDLSAAEKFRMCQDLAILEFLQPLIKETDGEFARLSILEPWARHVPFLVQLPGIAVLNAMTLLAAIGDVSRFPSPKHLVSYGGLGVSVHDSGQTHRGGGITKQGRREIRTVMVEAAWKAVETSAHWKNRFEQLEVRLGRNKAIVAIARKLLVVVWHVLTEQVADDHADPQKVAFKFMSWSYKLGRERRRGLTTGMFVRSHLAALGVGGSLETITRGRQRMQIPPLEGVPKAARAPDLA